MIEYGQRSMPRAILNTTQGAGSNMKKTYEYLPQGWAYERKQSHDLISEVPNVVGIFTNASEKVSWTFSSNKAVKAFYGGLRAGEASAMKRVNSIVSANTKKLPSV